MALAGRDTGGSQFFVTITPQPHLDGKYASFGEVVSGIDVVHAIAMQTMVMTSLALIMTRHRPSAVILHLTGLGYLGRARSPFARILRPVAHAALRRCMASQRAWLVAENSDDLATMVAEGVVAQARTALVPGAGVDPALFAQLRPAPNPVPRAAYVGRMVLSKGVHVLVEAHRLLQERGVPLDLSLYGAADPGSRQAIPRKVLAQWSQRAGVSWHGRTDDVVGVWREADIAVLPALGGEGMPRAMLEAAACGRPLVVSGVAGCRQFVRNGKEGFVVPPGDVEALARALTRLAHDPALRASLGAAAACRLVERLGGSVVGCSFLIALRFLPGAVKLSGHRVHSLVDYE